MRRPRVVFVCGGTSLRHYLVASVHHSLVGFFWARSHHRCCTTSFSTEWRSSHALLPFACCVLYSGSGIGVNNGGDDDDDGGLKIGCRLVGKDVTAAAAVRKNGQVNSGAAPSHQAKSRSLSCCRRYLH